MIYWTFCQLNSRNSFIINHLMIVFSEYSSGKSFFVVFVLKRYSSSLLQHPQNFPHHDRLRSFSLPYLFCYLSTDIEQFPILSDMTCIALPTCDQTTHAFKCFGWGSLTLITALAIPLIAIVGIALSAGLFVSSGFFLHRFLFMPALNLLWVIPTILLFTGADCSLAYWIGKKSSSAMSMMNECRESCYLNMSAHFNQL